jgi:hypothetical protein
MPLKKGGRMGEGGQRESQSKGGGWGRGARGGVKAGGRRGRGWWRIPRNPYPVQFPPKQKIQFYVFIMTQSNAFMNNLKCMHAPLVLDSNTRRSIDKGNNTTGLRNLFKTTDLPIRELH